MIFPRLLIVGNFISSSGCSRGVCEELAPRLRASGWSVLTTSHRRSRPARLMDMLYTVWKSRHEFDLAQVDVYSGPSFLWAEAVCCLLRRLGRPYVLTLHGGNLPNFARTANRRVAALLNSAAVVTVPSSYLLNQMRAYRRNLILLPNGLDLSAYGHMVRRPVQPHLVWLRAFHQIYNPAMAPRVIARLKKEFPAIRLTMAGPDKGDSSREATIATAKQYCVESQMEMQGALPKQSVPCFLSAGDIFLNTSRIDNTPVSVLEAMAAGMCVVSTDPGGIPYLLNNEQDALLVPVDDDIAMAEAVRRLLTDPALVERLQVAALAKVRSFDWSVVLPQWRALLTAVATGALSDAGPTLNSFPRQAHITTIQRPQDAETSGTATKPAVDALH
jgi:glycosyltransferase involved in cell wall biosynthesis